MLDHITPMNVRAKMESLTAKLDELSDSISAMRSRVEGAAGTDMEGIRRVSLARLLWEAESIIEMMDDPGQPMPWWREWQSALANTARPAEPSLR